jgi:hypothetical protein
MKKWILITAAVMFVAGLGLGGAYVALAQGNIPPVPFGGPGNWAGGRGWMHSPTFTGTVPYGRGPMMGGWGNGQPLTGTVPYGPGMMGPSNGPWNGPWNGAWGGPMSDMHVDIWTAVAQELGLTYDQLQTELRTKTLQQLAQEKGATLEKLQEVASSAWKTEIDELVEAGTLTREQADWMIQRMDSAGFPMFGLGQGLGPCGGGLGPQGPGFQGQQSPQGGSRGRGPGMLGRFPFDTESQTR